jgi:hypothetical protein
MQNLHSVNNKPLDPAAAQHPAAAASSTHHKNCGAVGLTGKHGEIGTNSAAAAQSAGTGTTGSSLHTITRGTEQPAATVKGSSLHTIKR